MLDIGLEVKILRERMHISAKELARRVGLSPSQMSRLEKGERRIDTGILSRIAEALGVDPSHFFRDSEAPVVEAVPSSDPGSLGKQVRTERRRQHVSAEELATRVGTTKARILSVEEGKRPLDGELAERIVRALRLPPGYFFTAQQEAVRRLEAQVARLDQALAEQGRGAAPGPPAEAPGETRGQAIPVLGDLMRGYPGTFDAAGEPAAEPDDFLWIPGVTDPLAFAVQVLGDSMQCPNAPSFAEGDLVVFVRGHPRSREFGFVRRRTHEPVFRQIFFDPGGRIRLQPRNLQYAPDVLPQEDILGMWRLAAHVTRW